MSDSNTNAATVMSGTAQMMTMSVAWGVYALLFALSVFLLIQKGVRHSTPRKILLFSTCLMFTASTALASIDTAIYLLQFSAGDNYLATSNKLQLACEVLFDSLFLMGDTIVLWRTWVLFPDRKVLVLFPITLWFGGLACMFSLLGVALHNGDISGWKIGVYDHGTTSLKLSMATASLSAATNFFSTLLISWKAWERRALFNTSLINAPGTRAKKIMSLLIESGFIYLGLWVLAMLNFYVTWNVPALQTALIGLYDIIIGTYPTLIIVLVHLDHTFWDCTSTTSSTRTSGTVMFSTIAPSMGTEISIKIDSEKQRDGEP
ncbi:hypothetical protein B0H14DRAFT_2681711 [Mycena olivaceomarginata]|nr:hypothetical protein B0H14DRAFT_2681711 [Mycena olivaceomarginata]